MLGECVGQLKGYSWYINVRDKESCVKSSKRIYISHWFRFDVHLVLLGRGIVSRWVVFADVSDKSLPPSSGCHFHMMQRPKYRKFVYNLN
jgi:hypothetical protein